MQIIEETNIPIPPINNAGARKSKYPFKSMKVGDIRRFLASPEEVKRIQRAAAAFARRHKVELVTRTVEGGLRVWRSA